MKKNLFAEIQGFTLIELIIFIILTSLLASTILLAVSIGTQKYPTVHQGIIATQVAKNCMEWFIGQRTLNGYSSLPCPSTTLPSYCTAPTGYTISTNIACTTIGSENSFKTITVTVTGLGGTVLQTLIADY